MLLSKKQFWILETLIWLYLLIALTINIYIYYFNKNLSVISKIIITILSFGLWGGSFSIQTFKQYKKDFLNNFYPITNSKKGFIILQLLFKDNATLNLHHLISFLNIMKNFVSMNGLYFCFSGLNDINLSTPKEFNLTAFKDYLSCFKDEIPSKLFIFDINRINISFNLFNCKNFEKIREFSIEINLDKNTIFNLEEHLNKIIFFLCSKMNYVYGRVFLKHNRNLISQSYYIDNKQFNKIDYEFDKCKATKLEDFIPDIYWVNLINSHHAAKINKEELSMIKNNVFMLYELPNNGYYIQLTKYINEVEKGYVQEKMNKIKIIFNEIMDPKLQNIIVYKFDYAKIISCF